MDQKFEKKLKAFLPYIIIIGIVYLIVPALLFAEKEKAGFITYFVLIGVLPLTAAGCCAHYAIKKENDFWLCLVAPIVFIPAMFLYPIFRSGPLIALIYLVSYLLCGYLGLTVGDILSNKQGKKNRSGDDASAPRKPARKAAERRSSGRGEDRSVDPDVPIRRSRGSSARPERVDVESPDAFFAEDPYDDETLDTATTAEDIDAILSEIHQRHGSE